MKLLLSMIERELRDLATFGPDQRGSDHRRLDQRGLDHAPMAGLKGLYIGLFIRYENWEN